MRSRMILAAAGVALLGAAAAGQEDKAHLNPMIELHAQRKPLFGLYAPANRGNRGGGAGRAADPSAPPAPPPVVKTPAELVKDALGYDKSDFIFNGNMEGGVDRGIGPFTDFVNALAEAAPADVRWRHPLSVKTPKIAEDPAKAIDNWTIVESRPGLARVREIAAVRGISVLFPGAGTLRGVFSTADAEGKRTFDAEGWEAAIQQVLAACKEFNVPCGYPATEADIETRMKQGFSVFVINWGDPGFRAIDLGRKAAGQ